MSIGMLQYMLLSVLPAVDNPNTGDANQLIMKIMVPALIIAAIVIVVYLVMGAKNKKGGKGKGKKK